MGEWLGRIAGILCIMTVMLQLIPEGSFAKYVRFYVSLLYLLVAAGPLLQLFSREDVLERFLKLELLKEEHFDLETAVEGLQELKNETFEGAWKRELVRQFGEIASAYGAQLENADLFVGDDNTLQEVNINITAEEEVLADVAEQIRKEIAGIYAVEPGHIKIMGREGR